MRYWWVNQNQTYRQEIDGGYMWSPKRKKNGDRNRFYENMREVRPDDVVFSFRDACIAAVGRICSPAYESLQPPEFGSRGENWAPVGWKVDVNFLEVPGRVRPVDFIDEIRPMLPSKYSPLNPKNGYGLQSVYLAEISVELADYLTALVDVENGIVPESIASDYESEWARSKQEIEDEQQISVESDPELTSTDREALVTARKGQGKFRESLQRHETSCRVTGVSNPSYLIASHIWPWRHATNAERLDGENGLLLAPHIDFLFDRGLISFDNDGALLVSPVADPDVLSRMGIPSAGTRVGQFSPRQREYLAKHRDGDRLRGGVFKKIPD